MACQLPSPSCPKSTRIVSAATPDSPVSGLKDLPQQGEKPHGHQWEGHHLQPLHELVEGERWRETRLRECVNGRTRARKGPGLPTLLSLSLSVRLQQVHTVLLYCTPLPIGEDPRSPSPPGIVPPALKHEGWGGGSYKAPGTPSSLAFQRARPPPLWRGGGTKGAEFLRCGTNLARVHSHGGEGGRGEFLGKSENVRIGLVGQG